MEYFSFLETRDFTRKIGDLISEDELNKLQLFLCSFPEHGVVIPGSGGIRKLRLGLEGRGKRGGARVIYFAAIARHRILLLDIYGKSVKADLSKGELKELKNIVQAWLNEK
jgi:hypothetical protein